MPLSLSYDDPITAVFLRTLAWEREVAKGEPKVKDLVDNQLQVARQELGLDPITRGAPHQWIQGLRKTKPPLLSEARSTPTPLQPQWSIKDKVWRVLYIPPHFAVRQLSYNPIIKLIPPNQNFQELDVVLRNSAVPELKVFIGKDIPKGGNFEKKKGVYFLRLTEGLYIGQTRELSTRLFFHLKKKKPKWWVFVTPQRLEQTLALDALEAAEALLISFWNEISLVSNSKRGTDQEPAFVYLQQAILLVESASAILLWLMRDQDKLKGKLAYLKLEDWNIPFKKCSAHGWPKCYLSPPD